MHRWENEFYAGTLQNILLAFCLAVSFADFIKGDTCASPAVLAELHGDDALALLLPIHFLSKFKDFGVAIVVDFNSNRKCVEIPVAKLFNNAPNCIMRTGSNASFYLSMI